MGAPVVYVNSAVPKSSGGIIQKKVMGVKNIGYGFHNINGLKTQGHRLEFLSSWAANKKIDLLGIAETNLKKREAKFLAKNLRDFSSFWSSVASGKYKGSGIGLL